MEEALAATAYLLGREHKRLTAATLEGQDFLFVAERLDGIKLQRGDFAHCTFANISFKESYLTDIRFLNCTFIGCYFRRTNLKGCDFSGCRFIACDFPKVAVRSCNFRYAHFDDCFIGASEIHHSLPQEPNLREELARNLATAAANEGFFKEARAFRLLEIRAREQDLRAAALGESQWYQEHYNSLARVGAGLQFLRSVFERQVWGSGVRAVVLFRTLLIFTLAIFPLIFLLLRSQLSKGGTTAVTFADLVFFSLENMVPAKIDSGITAVSNAARFTAGIEALLGLVITGLFASYLFAWINER
jgi:hypothetical protein